MVEEHEVNEQDAEKLDELAAALEMDRDEAATEMVAVALLRLRAIEGEK